MIITDIRPIEVDGQHWVDISMDGHAMKRRARDRRRHKHP